MKQVVSVSLGASSRDHQVETEIMGKKIMIKRIGTDGDLARAIELVRSLDGQVDAFGMGGIDLYIVAGGRRYVLKDALKLKRAARKTPMVDGSGLKDTLERHTIHYLMEKKLLDFKGKNVLLVCGVDRFGMAETLVEVGAQVTFGDLIFGLRIPWPLKSLRALVLAGRTLGPIVSKLPFQYLYPGGKEQQVIIQRYNKYYELNDVIAGDFHFIKKYLPENISGKIILTNTVTTTDLELLAKRGARSLITSTPELGGRSFGTNVLEAALVAILGKTVEEITLTDYLHILKQADFKPRIVDFASEKIG